MFILNEKCPVCKEYFYCDEKVADIGGKTVHLECLEEDFSIREILEMAGIEIYETDGSERPPENHSAYRLWDNPPATRNYWDVVNSQY